MGNFRSLVEAVQRRRAHVTVVSSVRTRPPMVADELRRQADAFLELDDLKAAIGRHWKRSRRATIEFRRVIVGSKSGTTRPDAGWPHVKYFHRSKIVFRSTTPVVFAYPHRTGAGEFISNQFSPGRPRALLRPFLFLQRDQPGELEQIIAMALKCLASLSGF